MRFASQLVVLCLLAGAATAQPPRDRPSTSDADALIARMMAFDKNKDGKLARDEITDPRLLRLFDRADADKDGVVTKEELIALGEKIAEEEGASGGFRGGPGGFGPPPGGPPRPGEVLPPFVRDRLNLTDAQKKQLEELQKEVEARLAQILTEEQKKQLKEVRAGFGRGGPGSPGGRPPRPPERPE
jgi:hypothetical protein